VLPGLLPGRGKLSREGDLYEERHISVSRELIRLLHFLRGRTTQRPALRRSRDAAKHEIRQCTTNWRSLMERWIPEEAMDEFVDEHVYTEDTVALMKTSWRGCLN